MCWLSSVGVPQVTTLLSKAEEAQAGETVSEDELAALEEEVSEQGALVSQIKEVRLSAVVMHMVAASGTCARARCMKQGDLHAKLGSFGSAGTQLTASCRCHIVLGRCA